MHYHWAESQGSTYHGPIQIDIGSTEKEHGTSYVAFSRATKLSNICVGSGFSVERLTTMISKGKRLINRLVEVERLQL